MERYETHGKRINFNFFFVKRVPIAVTSHGSFSCSWKVKATFCLAREKWCYIERKKEITKFVIVGMYHCVEGKAKRNLRDEKDGEKRDNIVYKLFLS